MKKVLVFALLAFLCVACGKKSEESNASQLTADTPRKATSRDLRQDYAKPYLTDEKMVKFIASMKEERNPFEVIFKEGGEMRGLGAMKEKIDEFNAFARRYGFQDYEDYTAVWGRIVVGEMQLWAGEAKKGVIEMTQQSIQSAQQELQKPNLDPEMRKMYQEQIENGQKSLVELEKSEETTLNDADLALVKKYKSQLEAAEKRYRKQPG